MDADVAPEPHGPRRDGEVGGMKQLVVRIVLGALLGAAWSLLVTLVWNGLGLPTWPVSAIGYAIAWAGAFVIGMLVPVWLASR
jgi:hypothetical protein